jgi:hypothetical protein
MPKITGLGAGVAPANTDVLVLVSNTAGTANTQKVTVNTFFSNVTANAKFANAEITTLTIGNILTVSQENVTTNAAALSLTKTISQLDADTTSIETTLANASIVGHVKIIVAKNVDNVVDVDFTSLGSGVTYTFQTIGESITLMWNGAAWIVTSRGSNETGSNVQGTMDVT